MKEIDCDSFRRHEARGANFSQLTKMIEDAQANINSYVSQHGGTDFSVQIIGKLEPPLQNLHQLLSLLFERTTSNLNEEQLKYLTVCNHVIANFYCAIQYFVQMGDKILDESRTKAPFIQTKRLDYIFCYTAHYELTTPYYSLKLYIQDISDSKPKTDESQTYLGRLLSSPFIPENRELLDELGYWTNRLEEFMDEAAKNSRKWQDDEWARGSNVDTRE